MNRTSIPARLSLFLLISIFSALLALLLTNIASASVFSLGNLSSSLQEDYSYSENLKGWINISFTNAPFNYLFTFYNTNISIKDLLKKNNLGSPGAYYNCTTYSCDMTYATNGIKETSKTLNLNSGESKTIGIIITGDGFDDITNFSLKVSSNNPSSCTNPLSIDILDDGIIDWVGHNSTKETCTIANNGYGCYEQALKQDETDVISDRYCNVMAIPKFGNIRIGANINRKAEASGNISFVMSISSDDLGEYACDFSTSSSGESYCDVNATTFNEENFTVCINAKSPADSGKYKIGFEDNNPCGYSSSYDHDFAIFARPLKYSTLTPFFLTTKEIYSIGNLFEIESSITDYLADTYSADCSDRCIIPIKLISESNQQITLSNLSLSYILGGLPRTETNLYLLDAKPSEITMSFRKLSLDNSGLKVPGVEGEYNATLYLNGEEVLKKTINVLGMPIIQDVSPTEAPAGVPTIFTVYASGSNITKYKWTFGDNTTNQETTSSKIEHKYQDIGVYKLSVSARNINGETNKTFTISVISPKDYDNATLTDYKLKISNLSTQIEDYPSLVKDSIEDQLNLTETEIELQSLQTQFNNAGSDDIIYISIANSLSKMNIPSKIKVTQSLSGSFIMNKDIININDLKAITSEDTDANQDVIKNSIYSWFINNIEVNADIDIYSAIYKNVTIPLSSYITLNIKPKTDQNTVYTIINKKRNEIKLGASISNPKYTDEAVGFSSDLSSGNKNVDFVIYGKTSIPDLPVYFSPLLSELPLSINISSACNYNNKCEKSLGEDWRNCKNDCKPWLIALIWLAVVFILLIVLYIIAQEWYKRNYENSLFKNKDDLFNLIHFIDNAEKQGAKKQDIFNVLRQKNWSSEQITYAYKKYKGERTGMWEIPLFRRSENKKLGEEIENRNKQGVNPKIPPKPITRPQFMQRK